MIQRRRGERGDSTVGTWEHGVITPVCSQCVPSVFPVCGNMKQGGKWRDKGLYREKTKCVPNVLTFFIYTAFRAFFFFFSLSLCIIFFLVKLYFFVGTVGTAGTWCHYANLSGNIFGFFGNTEWEQKSVPTFCENMGTLIDNTIS